jgi:DNA-binding NarL/FixJ family response regulator
MSDLSLDERVIAKLIAEGCDVTEIAERLGLGLDAVRQRIARAGRKIGGRGTPMIRLTRWWCLVGRLEAEARLQALGRVA